MAIDRHPNQFKLLTILTLHSFLEINLEVSTRVDRAITSVQKRSSVFFLKILKRIF